MDPITYQIKDWDEVFENRRTRQLDRPRYICFPTSQGSETFRELMQTADGILAYGVFCALLPIAARCERRGVLEDERGPLDAARIAKRLGAKAGIIEKCLGILFDRGWLQSAHCAPPARRPCDAHAPPARPSRDVRAPKEQEQERRGEEQEQEQEGGGTAVDAAAAVVDPLRKAEIQRHLRKPDWLPNGKPWISLSVAARLANSNADPAAVAAIVREARESRTTLDSPAAFIVKRVRDLIQNPPAEGAAA